MLERALSIARDLVGRGGHGARPHEVVDPIYIAGHVILGLRGIVSRRLYPFDQAVVSIGTVSGGEADNVIPERVDLSGTLRFMQPHVQRQLHAEVERALAVARALGGDYTLEIELGYPPTVNDPAVADLLRQVSTDLLGIDHVHLPLGTMGAEDFGFLCALAPGAMFRLGCRIEGDERFAHGPRFDIDEHCLPIGAAILAEAALRVLRGTG